MVAIPLAELWNITYNLISNGELFKQGIVFLSAVNLSSVKGRTEILHARNCSDGQLQCACNEFIAFPRSSLQGFMIWYNSLFAKQISFNTIFIFTLSCLSCLTA